MTLGHDGTLSVERGLIDPADVKAEKRARSVKAGGHSVGLSAALVEDLTAHRTAALRVELSGKPNVALATLAHAMASALLYGNAADSCLDLRASSEALERHTKAEGDSPAHRAMAEQAAWWGDRLPGEPADLFAWCLHQPQDMLLDLLAYLTALTVDAVQVAQGRDNPHADQLAEALSLDMRQWWTPTVEGFYQRLPKAALIHAVTEAKVTAAAPFDGVKKIEAARMAANALKDSGWLPEPLKEHEAALAA